MAARPHPRVEPLRLGVDSVRDTIFYSNKANIAADNRANSIT